VLDFHMPVSSAVEAPRIHHQWIPDRLNFEAPMSPQTRKGLEERGHALREQNALGVAQAIARQGAQLSGAADPRKVDRARAE
jgi:gamma-glutamyltranspeptidase/glutathione hydrolase